MKDAAGKLTGAERREFMARVTSEWFGGNARKAEREMGWGRETVKKGQRELQTGITCPDNYRGRGNKKTVVFCIWILVFLLLILLIQIHVC